MIVLMIINYYYQLLANVTKHIKNNNSYYYVFIIDFIRLLGKIDLRLNNILMKLIAITLTN